jgi:SAM-dependent methyltransferase
MVVDAGVPLAAASPLGPRARDAIVCPVCRVDLSAAGEGLLCPACHACYPIGREQVDLRPQGTVRVRVETELGVQRPVPYLDSVRSLAARPGSPHDPGAIDWTFDVTHGSRMTPALFTHIPDLPSEGGLLVDLGCGDSAIYGRLLRSTGFEVVGLDVAGSGPDILGDAHRLPFRDGSVDAIVAISVLEHLRYPAVALCEIHRVLRPGGALIGSVALVEPFHMGSYLHHTHLGTLVALSDAGFAVEVVAPSDDWSGVQAYAEMALFPGFWRLSWLVATPFVRVLQAASWVWWRVIGGTRRLPADAAYRSLLLASGFRYVARKLAGPAADQRDANGR